MGNGDHQIMKNYEAKFKWLADKYHWICPIAKAYGKYRQVTELHHSHIHNTKIFKKLYPLFIDSLWNLIPVNNAWHLKYGSFGKWPEERVSRCEIFLQRHKKIAEYLNNPEICNII